MRILGILVIALTMVSAMNAQNLKPYILAFESTDGISVVKDNILANLESNALKVVGQYQPAADKNRWVIIYTSDDLLDAVKQIGGLSAFASTQRIGITVEDGKTVVSYTNPVYWGNAYFQDNYDKISPNYSSLELMLKRAMAASGTYKGRPFGSEKGIEEDDLREYQYMMGMPEFDDTIELGDFNDYKSAISAIDSKLENGVPNVNQVYKITIPESELTLYGFALSGEEGENNFVPIIDNGSPKHTAFLPYEVLVMGDEVHMLHGRYRIALSFPDLTMGTFSKIMSTPGAIEKMLEQLVQ